MSNKVQSAESWAIEEFASIDMNDKRLDRRCLKLAEDLSQQPSASINQACEDWAASKAAYRFFANEGVTPEQILLPHTRRTQMRMQGHAVVLAVQDTTFFNYTGHPKTKGLGEIGTKTQHQRGFGLHSTLAVTPQGQPLGLLTQAYVERPLGQPAHTPSEVRKLPMKRKRAIAGCKRSRKRLT